MFKLILLSCAAVLICSCSNQHENELHLKDTDNRSYSLSYLFEVDGCKVYRFRDKGEYQYITSCPQAKVTSDFTHLEGKILHHYRHQEIKVNHE